MLRFLYRVKLVRFIMRQYPMLPYRISASFLHGVRCSMWKMPTASVLSNGRAALLSYGLTVTTAYLRLFIFCPFDPFKNLSVLAQFVSDRCGCVHIMVVQRISIMIGKSVSDRMISYRWTIPGQRWGIQEQHHWAFQAAVLISPECARLPQKFPMMSALRQASHPR